MEPPSLAQLTVFIIASLFEFVLVSYEATFALLSRSSLERLRDSGASRADLMLGIHEPRHRLHSMARIGQTLGAVVMTLSFLFFIQSFLQSPRYAILATLGVCTTVLFSSTSLARRIRFDEEGETMRIPTFTVAYVPVHALLLPLTKLIERIAQGESSAADIKASNEEELRSMVDAQGETGVLEEGEREMLHSVFGFHDRVAREVMSPRVDIIAVEQNSTLADLLRVARESGHSRFPLYEDSLDQIRGMVYTKDLLHLIVQYRNLDLNTPLSEFMKKPEADAATPSFVHEPYYVPETKKVDELLTDLRTARTRIAIVVDEYGGTAGLVSTEDLVEEIVGELQDEYDEEEALYHWRKKDEVLVVNPRINIDEINDLMETDLFADGFDTLGGFIYHQLGQVPESGERLEVPGLEIEILQVVGQRIARVLMTRVPIEQESTESRTR